jgi:alginate O-acetyltransferase complex protein AlgI
MIYNTPWFLGFFACFYMLLCFVPGSRLRLVALLIGSAIFHYHFAGAAGVIPIIGIALFTYALGGRLERSPAEQKRAWLFLGLLVPILALLYYKYRLFLLTSLEAFWPGSQNFLAPWAIAAPMPLAISFFSFEFIHYLTEIYRGRPAAKSPLHFAIFCIYFPSIVSGPIKRFQDFDAQMDRGLPLPWRNPKAAEGLAQALLGFAKKMVVADNCVTLIGALENRGLWSPASAASLIALQSIRILFDFSGYSDIAIGLAKMIGLEVPRNFNFPYLARDIQDFWRRWHISLSSWIRDYIYIPLGGSRAGIFRKGFNLLLAMALCGLWHGAAWNYVIWGLYHGLGLGVHAWLSPRLPTRWKGRWPYEGLSWLVTLLFVCYGWLWFFYPWAKSIEISRGLLGL